jgi:hypothetical protein
MIEVAWTIGTQIVAWGQAAFAAAQKKGEQRYARVVENSATLAAGVTTLNRQLQGLLQPLAFFEPAEWDQTRRTAHVNALIAFGHEETILPRMRMSRTTLRGLLVDTDDVDIRRTAGRILALADDLFDSPANVIDRAEQVRSDEWRLPDDPAPEQPVFAADTPTDYADSTSTLIGFAVLERDEEEAHPDTGYNMYLPGLLNVLRRVRLGPGPSPGVSDEDAANWHQEQQYEADSVRTNATKLLATKPMAGYRETAEDDDLQGVLFPAAVEMQHQFGELLAISQRVFPTMPSPTFAL